MKTRKNYFLCKRETKIESYMKLLQSVRIKQDNCLEKDITL